MQPACRTARATARRWPWPCHHARPQAACRDARARAYNQQDQSAQLPRFYAQEPLDGRDSFSVALSAEESKHALKALRLAEGSQLELCDGRGNLATCVIGSVDRGIAWVHGVERAAHHPWQGPEWTLAVACTTLKGGRTDWLVEKATELGARRLVPLVTARSQAGTKNKFRTSSGAKGGGGGGGGDDDYQPGRLERVAAAATKQSLRAHALQLAPPTALQDVLPLVAQSSVSLLAVGGAPPALEVLQRARAAEGYDSSGAHLLLVGPEGDFTDEELQQLSEAGALPVGLGSNRLRTETAALALLATAVLSG